MQKSRFQRFFDFSKNAQVKKATKANNLIYILYVVCVVHIFHFVPIGYLCDHLFGHSKAPKNRHITENARNYLSSSYTPTTNLRVNTPIKMGYIKWKGMKNI